MDKYFNQLGSRQQASETFKESQMIPQVKVTTTEAWTLGGRPAFLTCDINEPKVETSKSITCRKWLMEDLELKVFFIQILKTEVFWHLLLWLKRESSLCIWSTPMPQFQEGWPFLEGWVPHTCTHFQHSATHCKLLRIYAILYQVSWSQSSNNGQLALK